MSEQNELAKRDPAMMDAGVTLKGDYQSTKLGIIPRTVDEALTIAKAFAASGYFKDIQNASQAVAKIMYGAELGMTAAASMQSIYFFEGKMTLGGIAIGAIIKRSGRYKVKILQSDKKACRIEFFEKDEDGKWESQGVSAFTIEDATVANLTKKDVWIKYSQDMLFNRAMSAGAKRYSPDIFGGMPVYTEEEVEDFAGPKPDPMRNAEISQSEKIRAKLAPEPTQEEKDNLAKREEKIDELAAKLRGSGMQPAMAGIGDVHVYIGDEKIDGHIVRVQNRAAIRSNGR